MKKKKLLSGLLAFGLSASLLFQASVMGEESTDVQAEETAADTSGAVSTNSIPGWPQAPDIVSEAAVVMEDTTSTFLYSKNMDETLSPGSAVKIMTCLLALENASREFDS